VLFLLKLLFTSDISSVKEPSVITAGSTGNKSLLQKMETFSEFPHFWEEEQMDPTVQAEQDKEVRDFEKRLEEMNKVCVCIDTTDLT
jgi:hypothetical protein